MGIRRYNVDQLTVVAVDVVFVVVVAMCDAVLALLWLPVGCTAFSDAFVLRSVRRHRYQLS